MRIAFFEIEPWEAEYIKEKYKKADLEFFEEPLDEQNIQAAESDILVPFVGCKLSAQVLQNFPNLKFIATRSTGYDHVDLNYCAQKNIPVGFVPTYGENTVAEFTFGLLLTLSRKLYLAAKQVKEEADFNCEKLMGFDLKGKTIGVVGAGHIGVHVIKIAYGFDMNIVAYDPHPSPELEKEYGVKFMDLESLIKASDVVTLHVPYMPATHHLINKDNLKLFKKGAVLINTARGGLVDTNALLESLKEGILGGAAMDVLEEEGFVKDEIDLLYNGHPSSEQLKTALLDHELVHCKNVIVTPHMAFNTKEAIMRILDTTILNIESFLKNEPVNLVKVKETAKK